MIGKYVNEWANSIVNVLTRWTELAFVVKFCYLDEEHCLFVGWVKIRLILAWGLHISHAQSIFIG